MSVSDASINSDSSHGSSTTSNTSSTATQTDDTGPGSSFHNNPQLMSSLGEIPEDRTITPVHQIVNARPRPPPSHKRASQSSNSSRTSRRSMRAPQVKEQTTTTTRRRRGRRINDTIVNAPLSFRLRLFLN